MQKMKVITVVGTRPEVIKLSRIIAILDKYCDHILVHTGQNHAYELNQVFFDDLEIRKPDYFLEVVDNNNLAETVGNIICRSDMVFAKEEPEALLIYGDTNSCLCAYSAKRRKIPIFHMEAGNRCFDQRVPEEINRKIIDHISDINITLSEHARRYLIAEGIKPETIIKLGSCVPEILEYYSAKIDASDILQRLNLAKQQYFLISMHREENVDVQKNLISLLESMQFLSSTYAKKIIVSTHPRTRDRLETLFANQEYQDLRNNIEFLQAFGFHDYMKLQKNAFCVLSDSGSITEDSTCLDIPAVNIRQAHERPEGVDVGSWILSGVHVDKIAQAVEIVVNQHNNDQSRSFTKVPDYLETNVSQKVLRVILSYVEYINRTVWFKGQ